MGEWPEILSKPVYTRAGVELTDSYCYTVAPPQLEPDPAVQP